MNALVYGCGRKLLLAKGSGGGSGAGLIQKALRSQAVRPMTMLSKESKEEYQKLVSVIVSRAVH